MIHLKLKEEALDIFASMHLTCIGVPETPNEKITRYILEVGGYITGARDRLGGEYEVETDHEFKMELQEYFMKFKKEDQ